MRICVHQSDCPTCGVAPQQAARLLAIHLQVPLKTLAGGVSAAFVRKAVAIVRGAK